MDRIRQLVVRLAEERGTTLKALSLAMELKSINPDYDTYELPLASLQINGRVIGKWAWQ